jgi:hypothetical protein
MGLRADGFSHIELADSSPVTSSFAYDWFGPLYEWGRTEGKLMLAAHRGSERCRVAALGEMRFDLYKTI